MKPRRLVLLAMVALVAGILGWRWFGTERSGILTITPHWPFSAPVRALHSFEGATDVELVSLQAWGETTDQGGTDADAEVRCRGECLVGNPVLGRVAVSDPVRRQQLAQLLDQWLAKRSNADEFAACAPEYHHAVAWTKDGRRYEALLCFGCAIYRIRVDGKDVIAYDQAGRDDGEEWFNARFAEAGVRYFDVERHTYVPHLPGTPAIEPPPSR